MTQAPHVNETKAAGKIAPDQGVLSRYPLIFFFIIACAGSWLVVLPYLRSASGAGLLPFAWPVPFAVSAALAPFAGPFLAAFVMTGVTEGTPGIRRLLGRFVQWRVGLWWYLFALVGLPAIMVLGAIAVPGYTWVFNNTKGSLVVVALLHASNDAFFTEKLFPAPIVTDSLLPTAIGFGMAALLLVVLTRGRLGYQDSEQQETVERDKTLREKRSQA